METKICRKCKQEKPLCDFSKNIAKKDKLQSICKACDVIKSREYKEKDRKKHTMIQKRSYEKNKEKYLKKGKEYYKKNKDKIINNTKNYYLNNIDKIKLRKKAYLEINRERNKSKSKEYSKKNRKILSEKEKIRRNTDPVFRTIKNVINRINGYLSRNHFKKNSKSFDLIGCSPDFLKNHIESQFTDGMSWDLMGRKIHIDHIIPLSSAKNEEDAKKLCHYTNLRPLWAEENLIKADKILTS